MGKPKKIEVGDVFPMNTGGSVTVIENNGWDKILVECNDEYKYRYITTSSNVRKGALKNPYAPVILGIGYYGVGKHLSTIDGKTSPIYNTWANMLHRCYSPRTHKTQPTYIGCSVHPDWFNFQVFAEWCSEQPNSNTDGFALDKDLIIFGNKVYSPDTCSFVPREINTLLSDCAAVRGDLPQGVSRCGNKYHAKTSVNGERLYLGTFDTIIEAAFAYSAGKTENVKEQVEIWKEYLHPTVYTNLKNFDFDVWQQMESNSK